MNQVIEAIAVENLVTEFGNKRVHDDISFAIPQGSIVALIGGSGTGKSTLLREILGLQRPAQGRVTIFGQSLHNCDRDAGAALRKRFGVLFQSGALFSALTCGENIALPLMEQYDLPNSLIADIVQLRLGLVGLSSDVATKMPNELSGGMIKRVALARALATEPEVLFLDEPTSGLDPISARGFDTLVRTLQKNLGLTVFMVTHDLDSLYCISPRVIVLGGGAILADGSLEHVSTTEDPWIQEYFHARYSPHSSTHDENKRE